MVFLDLKKAFDTVDHGVLLGKLSLYGIQESAYDWFKSYLNNRTQKCVVNGSLSKVCSLGCGVPQGTILGPLLFFIYINDLPNCLSFCQPRMFADDTHITYASADLHSMQSSLNRDFSNIHKHAWKFLLQFRPTFFGTVPRLVPNKDKFKMAT